MLTPDLVLDGYRLIREIGRGGFGEVWLCRLEATGEYKALKFLSASDADHLERERTALIRYRSVASQIQCPNLISIEHVNRTQAGLFYVMPLADGQRNRRPEDSDWKAKTLDSLIQARKGWGSPRWFGADEIRGIMIPLLEAIQRLSDAGIVHRDIKPENILFIGGCPCLGDISLLTDDAATLTRRGTPGYAAPSWYVESGGNPDMWGIATTFYSLLTGNNADKMGRAAFLWPPQGEMSVDRDLWKEFRDLILRATQEEPNERFLQFDAFADAIRRTAKPKPEPAPHETHIPQSSPRIDSPVNPPQPSAPKRFSKWPLILALTLAVLVFGVTATKDAGWGPWHRTEFDFASIPAALISFLICWGVLVLLRKAFRFLIKAWQKIYRVSGGA